MDNKIVISDEDAKIIREICTKYDLFASDCDICGIPIIAKDPRSTMYPPPDIFGEDIPEYHFLCHECFLEALSEDEAARQGCCKCGEPVQSSKFSCESGVICSDCFSKMANGER